jgi:putative transferase (TIGR04331 family)
MNNNSFFLVTTSLKESRSEKIDNLFLGHWCLDYEEIEKFPNSNLLNYHWSNVSVLESDYKFIDKIYNKFLLLLTEKLNHIHGVHHSERYWRILIGPWLGYFIHGMYDKWKNLHNALDNYNISETIIVDFPEEEMIPNDMNSFITLFSSNEWNHFCYSQIILFLKSKYKFKKQHIKPSNSSFNNLKSITKTKFSLLIKLKNIFNSLAYRNKIVIASTYLGFWNELKLNFKFKQAPFFYYLRKFNTYKPNFEFRKSLNELNYIVDNFETFLMSQVFSQIPICFLEAYSNLVDEACSNIFPQNPKIIYTSNITTYDVISMAYIANNIDNGCKLIHGQHGGYGIPKFMFLEDHEIKISDKFLSWGWTKNNEKVFPLGMQIPVEKYKRNYPKKNYLLLVRGLWPKYLFRIDSGSGLNLNNTIEECINLSSLLKQDIRDLNLLVRLYHTDYGFNEKQRWEKALPGVNFSDKDIQIHQLVKDAKLVVYTYNVSTGYLEYINANIPTILFWDMSSSPVSEEAIAIFDELKNVGIFHNNAASAASHINLIWEDVEGWWNSDNVANARMKLCSLFANIPNNIVNKVENILTENL